MLGSNFNRPKKLKAVKNRKKIKKAKLDTRKLLIFFKSEYGFIPKKGIIMEDYGKYYK